VKGSGSLRLPKGTVTFLLADIEGSTRAWEAEDEGAVKAAVSRFYEILDEAVSSNGGVRPIEQGEGDSVVGVFPRASDAVTAALQAQRELGSEGWPISSPLLVRMALHSGEAQLRDEGNYFGPVVNRCARLRDLAHGGQVLVSRATHDLVTDQLVEKVSLRDLGSHRLRDLGRAEEVFQLCHPDLEGEFPALRSLDSRPHNLPAQLTSFIGREQEVPKVRELFASHRLVTLTGAGGCGKTRLALQVAAGLVADYPDGVWWVDLAAISDPDLAPNTVGAAMGIREAPGESFTATLERVLAERKTFVLLDNCEHLIEACAELCHVLLRSCPELVVLATSRESLGVDGETTWRVPSLLVAERVEALEQSEAVRLFCDRAKRARPTFALTEDNAEAVFQICRRLDGIPLAIELAAARVRVLDAAQIAAGLDDRFRLLAGGTRTALPRQRTLEASVDWSYNLLDERQRTLFRRLSVFAGSFALDSAEAVCSGEGIDGDVGGQPAGEAVVERRRQAEVLVIEIAHPWRHPLRHLYRKRDDQDDVPYHSGVEQVAPEPAIEVLAEHHGRGGADGRHPPLNQRRESEGEQHGGHDGRAVAQPGPDRPPAQVQHQRLRGERGGGGHEGVDGVPIAEDPHGGEGGRNQRVEHAPHVGGHIADHRRHMWCRCRLKAHGRQDSLCSAALLFPGQNTGQSGRPRRTRSRASWMAFWRASRLASTRSLSW
jgi:class 3 adenylate cyclase